MRIASTIGASSVEHDGVTYEPGEDGVFDVPQEVGEDLTRFSHWVAEHVAVDAATAKKLEDDLDPTNLHGRVTDLEAQVKDALAKIEDLGKKLADAVKPASKPADPSDAKTTVAAKKAAASKPADPSA